MGSGGTRTRTLASRTHLVVACLLALTFAALAAPRPALADTGGWASHPWPGCLGGTNSGGWDDSGLVYVPCGNPSVIAVYDESAHLVRTIPTGRFVTDAAPTRDGAFLYLAGPAGLTRMARQPTGSYAPDTAWHPDSFQMWGSTWQPQGHYVATDSAGNVYLADGTWTQNIAHTVIKYDPAGHVVTRFGEWANSWGTGTFYWALAGLAVSGDGATVYTVEIGNNRIQRWTRQGSGAYTATSTFGSNEANNPTREGFCDYAGWRGTLAAPYDIALDGAGNVYVINTTCKQVLSWTPDLSALRLNADVRVAGGDYPRPHGFTVGRDGTVYVGENQRMLRPAGGALPSDGLPPAAGSVGGTGSDGGQTGTGSGSAGSASPGNSSASTGDDDQFGRLLVQMADFSSGLDGIRKVEQGYTTLEELMRVVPLRQIFMQLKRIKRNEDGTIVPI